MEKIIEQLESSWCMDISKREYLGVPQEVFFIFNSARQLVWKDPSSALEYCEATLQSGWELLNVGRWSCVPVPHQQIYADASYLKCLLLIEQAHNCLDRTKRNCILKTALKACDMGLLLGVFARKNAVHQVAQLLNSLLNEEDGSACNEASTEELHLETEELHLETEEPHLETEEPHLETAEPHLETAEPHLETEEPHLETEEPHLETEEPHLETEEPHLETAEPHLETEEPHLETEEPHLETEEPHLETEEQLPPAETVPSLDCPSLETFYRDHFRPMQPTVLTNCIEHWPARTLWNAEYLKQVAGGRTVPVELGSSYADDDWGQQLMTIEKFVDEYMLQPSASHKPKGYLAQHMLFDQLPHLKNDIYEPVYCLLQLPQHERASSSSTQTEDPDDSSVLEINAWFGPAGTVSPLHYDSKHNIFAQVYGYKRVWLFHPEDSAYLYPHDSPLLYNTARTDPEKPDLEMFPQYAKARAYRCVLRPGDCLYIPPLWWHHVRALSPSMSVSFWWI